MAFHESLYETIAVSLSSATHFAFYSFVLCLLKKPSSEVQIHTNWGGRGEREDQTTLAPSGSNTENFAETIPALFGLKAIKLAGNFLKNQCSNTTHDTAPFITVSLYHISQEAVSSPAGANCSTTSLS